MSSTKMDQSQSSACCPTAVNNKLTANSCVGQTVVQHKRALIKVIIGQGSSNGLGRAGGRVQSVHSTVYARAHNEVATLIARLKNDGLASDTLPPTRLLFFQHTMPKMTDQ